VRTGAVLPVKRFTEAKQRLSDGLTPGVRRALAEAMLTDVLLALRRSDGVDEVVVVTAEPAAEAIARGYGARVAHDPHEDGQSIAAMIGLRELDDVDCALLVPGDCPALDASEIDALLRSVAQVDEAIVVIPDRHGTGTNGLVLRPPDAIVPAFGPGSRERHEELAGAAGLPARVEALPSLVMDVDTVADLDAMRAVLEGSHGGAAFTRGLLRRLARSGDVPARA
jgi:2-phospho-L-lactate guanylyltransferase